MNQKCHWIKISYPTREKEVEDLTSADHFLYEKKVKNRTKKDCVTVSLRNEVPF